MISINCVLLFCVIKIQITSLNISGIYKETIKVGIKKKVTNALFEVKELFRRPLIFRLILFSAVTFMCLLV